MKGIGTLEGAPTPDGKKPVGIHDINAIPNMNNICARVK